MVSSIVAAPGAGYLGDRLDRRRVMIASDLAAAAVSLALASSPEPLLLVLLFGLHTIVQSPFEPASAAALPNLVPAGDVPRANALVAASTSAGYLVGPLLGGALLGLGAAPSAVFVFDAASFVVSAALVASIRRPFRAAPVNAAAASGGALAGARLLARDPCCAC